MGVRVRPESGVYSAEHHVKASLTTKFKPNRGYLSCSVEAIMHVPLHVTRYCNV